MNNRLVNDGKHIHIEVFHGFWIFTKYHQPWHGVEFGGVSKLGYIVPAHLHQADHPSKTPQNEVIHIGNCHSMHIDSRVAALAAVSSTDIALLRACSAADSSKAFLIFSILVNLSWGSI